MHISDVPKCTLVMCQNAHLRYAKMCICTLVDMHNCAFVDM